jgi:HSP20 family protein
MNSSRDLVKKADTGMSVKSEPTKQMESPRIDVLENRDEFLLYADLPGISPDEVSIHLDKEMLTIETRRAAPPEGQPFSTAFVAPDYRRSFTAPAGIDADNVKAEFANGVLCLHLPKSTSMKPREIQVRAG